MAKLSFSKNWNNKMCCDIFTTIRYKSPLKIGDIVSVTTKLENSTVNSFAQVVSKESFLLKDIPEAVFAFDMGLSKSLGIKEIERIYTQYNIHEIYFDILCLKHFFPTK